ncbi:MAG: YfiR family protein, partial [Bacillota bacterium]
MVLRALRLIGTSLFAALALPAMPAAAQAVPEYDLKAAFVYNFALFAEWPPDTVYEDGALNICVSPGSALRAPLVGLSGRPIKGRRIAVRNLGATGNAQACQVVFLDSGDRERW